MNELIYKTEITHRLRKQTYLSKGKEGHKLRVWD